MGTRFSQKGGGGVHDPPSRANSSIQDKEQWKRSQSQVGEVEEWRCGDALHIRSTGEQNFTFHLVRLEV